MFCCLGRVIRLFLICGFWQCREGRSSAAYEHPLILIHVQKTRSQIGLHLWKICTLRWKVIVLGKQLEYQNFS
jgi:hypothetical protein